MPVAEALLALCMACHGPQGNTKDPAVPSLAGQPRLFIENQLVLIREGMRQVPQMHGMMQAVKDHEIVELAAYFNQQKPQRIEAAVKDDMYRRGQSIAQRALCGSCHLPDFSGREQIPRIAWQPEPFLLQSMKEFRDRPARGRDTIMAAALYGLKDDELADLAHYFANLR